MGRLKFERFGIIMVLQANKLSKSFPGVQALEDVSIRVEPGTVHAVMGENGAGKSTLMNILIGMYQPDAGEIRFKGRPVRIPHPHDALKIGISMIHQELMPFRDLTVAENIYMGREPTRRFPGWIDRRRMNREAIQRLDRLGVSLDPERRMRELSVAEMQTVEIAKALAFKSDVIIMDEPTSAISDHEVDRLFGIIRDLNRDGVAVIYISHRLDEIFRIADTVTVLRDGRHIATHEMADVDKDMLIALMVGRVLKESSSKPETTKGEVALEVREFTRRGAFQEVSFAVRRGEVLGIAGLMGAGRTELVSAIYGLAPLDSGELFVDGKPAVVSSPRDALAKGIALVTEDRKEYGLVLNQPVKHNITLSTLRRYCRAGLIHHGQENRAADERIRLLNIRTPDRNRIVDYLSGGNQQKVVVAKALLTEPEILILDEPTRGIDIGAKAEVHAMINRLAAGGKAIVMVSSELPEVLSISDRILVMREGTVAAELDASSTAQEEIMKFAVPD